MPMLDDFASLFCYHRDADEQVLEACGKLPHGAYAEAEPFEAGWPSIRSLVVHLAWANDAWARRFLDQPPVARSTEADLPALADAAALLVSAHDRFARDVVPALTPGRLASIWTYRSAAGKPYATPLWAALRHVVNHGTYHRGQIASKLARRGITPPATDLIYWSLRHTPQPE